MAKQYQKKKKTDIFTTINLTLKKKEENTEVEKEKGKAEVKPLG